MAQLTPSQVRIIDPVLTSIAQGFKQLDLVGYNLFPQVNVGLRAGNIITFGKEDFMLYNTKRAPGETTRRVQFGYAGSPFALVDSSIEGALPIELQQEASAPEKGFTIDMANIGVRKAQAILALALEKAQADLARTAGNYGASNKVTLSGTSQWSDLANSDPIANIETAKEAIRAQTGRRPNTMVFGPATMKALRQHPKIIDRTKYTGRDVPTTDLLSSLFGIQNVIVGEGVYFNDAGTTMSDIWGKDVVLAYTETASVADMGTPSYGYTYNLSGYPIAEPAYFERPSKTWAFPVTRCEAPVIASAISGYLITNAVA